MSVAPSRGLKRPAPGSFASKGIRVSKRARRQQRAFVPKQSIAAVVRSVMNRAAEMKSASISINQQFDGAINSNVDVVSVFPVITQGVAEYANRIGNKINVFNVTVKGYAIFPGPVPNFAGSQYLARILILAQKNQNSYANAATAFDFAHLLVNETALDPGVNLNGIIMPVNEDAFTVKFDQVKAMSAPYGVAYTNSGPMQQGNVWQFQYTFSFPKGKMIQYAEDASLTPTNWPYFLCAAFALSGGGIVAGINALSLVYTSTVKYTDI